MDARDVSLGTLNVDDEVMKDYADGDPLHGEEMPSLGVDGNSHSTKTLEVPLQCSHAVLRPHMEV